MTLIDSEHVTHRQSSPIGFMSAVSQAVVEKTRAFFDDETLELYDMDGLHVTMEYPLVREEYPCVQIDFSPSKVTPYNTAGGAADFADLVRTFVFEGTVNFYVYALTHLESDRFCDGMVSMVMGDPSFKREMHFNKYVPMDVNVSDMRIGARTVSQGTPWDDDQFVYYGAFSLPAVGEFAYSREGTVPTLVEHVAVRAERQSLNGDFIDEVGFVTPPQ